MIIFIGKVAIISILLVVFSKILHKDFMIAAKMKPQMPPLELKLIKQWIHALEHVATVSFLFMVITTILFVIVV